MIIGTIVALAFSNLVCLVAFLVARSDAAYYKEQRDYCRDKWADKTNELKNFKDQLRRMAKP